MDFFLAGTLFSFYFVEFQCRVIAWRVLSHGKEVSQQEVSGVASGDLSLVSPLLLLGQISTHIGIAAGSIKLRCARGYNLAIALNRQTVHPGVLTTGYGSDHFSLGSKCSVQCASASEASQAERGHNIVIDCCASGSSRGDQVAVGLDGKGKGARNRSVHSKIHNGRSSRAETLIECAIGAVANDAEADIVSCGGYIEAASERAGDHDLAVTLQH